MLVVNKKNNLPGLGAFSGHYPEADTSHDAIELEQRRCLWFDGYSAIFGVQPSIPKQYQTARILTPQSTIEAEIQRAVSDAINRVHRHNVETTTLGKEYPDSLNRSELMVLVSALWEHQKGRCALTNVEFSTEENNGHQDDKVSLDRIDNSKGYSSDNIQLTTQFANRARGTLSVTEAKRRLVQK